MHITLFIDAVFNLSISGALLIVKLNFSTHKKVLKSRKKTEKLIKVNALFETKLNNKVSCDRLYKTCLV